MPEWNEQQLAAIEDAGGSMLVNAAAGSGKTTVLVERAVRLITREEDPIPADRLLILTFTNAAAAELRSRIAARVEKAVLEADRSAALQKQRLRLKRAFIGTMDAFCQQMVREFFTHLNLPPDVEVGDETATARLREDALADTMEAMCEDEDFAGLLALYGSARSDKKIEEAILDIYAFTRSLPNPDNVLEGFAEAACDKRPLGETPWGRELLEAAASAAAAAAELAQNALEAAETEEGLAPYCNTLKADIYSIGLIQTAVAAGKWDSAVAAVRNYKPLALGRAKGEYSAETKEYVHAARADIKKIREELEKSLLPCFEKEYMADSRAAKPYVLALVRAVRLFGETFTAAKLADKTLDFSDFQHLAYSLLVEEGKRTDVAKRVSGRYEAVMVDEYQDTNDLQSALYESLANEEGTNLFYVGDVKQCIYRFRSANPGVFLEKRARWAGDGSEQAGRVINLGYNYRSGTGVINGVNHLFSCLMSPALGEVAYDENERLLQGSEGGDVQGMELCLVDDPDKRGDAEYVAARIAAMVAGEYPVRERDGGTRPCDYGDFCIMLRTNGHMPEYAAALAARGIPVAAANSADTTASPEIQPLVAALGAVNNPGDDVMLCAVMMGPLFAFSANDMAAIRAATPKGSLYGAVQAAEAAGNEKVRRFLLRLRYWRALACEAPVGRLCEEVAVKSGYLSAVAAMDGGAARSENVLAFIGWANGVSASLRGGLAGFMRLLDSGAAGQGGAYKALKGHVSLLTVHKSKGLEFPVCFLARAGHRFNKLELQSQVQAHRDLGIGLFLRSGGTLYPTLQAAAIRQRRQREALSEEMRVLYVALTRAKEKMIITHAAKDAQKTLDDAMAAKRGGVYGLSRASSFAAWVLAAVAGTGTGAPGAGFVLARVAQNAEAEVPPEQTAYRLTARPDEALLAALLAEFAKRPRRLALRDVPAKISVSQLAKPHMDTVRGRPQFMYKSGLTAVEKGTAMHLFMQMANYAAAKEDPAKEAARLAAQGFIDGETATALDVAGIRGFFASPLAGRMGQAKEVLREYDFITAIPAGEVDESLPPEEAAAQVLVQGIADAVLVFDGYAEIADYKTDHGKTPAQLAEQYKGQLALYKRAIEKRLGVPVARTTLWSFDLGAEVDVEC